MTGRARPASFVVDVDTSLGLARAHCDVPGRALVGRLLLGHGAGGGVDGSDLLAARDAAVRAGWAVARVEQPWRVAGKRVAPAAARLDVGWLEVARTLLGTREQVRGPATAREERADDAGAGGPGAGRPGGGRVFGVPLPLPVPLVLGGRSAGARVACRTAGQLGADGVLCLSFPLHPPGRPERSRAGELAAVVCPVLVVQGERDPFGGPDEVRRVAPAGARVVGVAGDHSPARDAGAVEEAVTAFLAAL